MRDVVNFVMLVCAAVASMGIGVYAAYAIFRCGFWVMRRHTQSATVAVNTQAQPARVL